MNEKIKWFGRYLGCEAVSLGLKSGRKFKFKNNIENLNTVGTCIACEEKLILKELKDISDEDLKGVEKIYSSKIKNKDEYVRDWYDEMIYAGMLVEEVDFLRSKGYAVGIPREYYITEEELV